MSERSAGDGRPRPARRSRLWRLVRLVSGTLLLVLAVIGALLPILQGWVFFIAGLSVLATDVPWARRWLHKLRDQVRRTPKETAQRSDDDAAPR